MDPSVFDFRVLAIVAFSASGSGSGTSRGNVALFF